MPLQKNSLRKRIEGEFIEDEANISKLIEVLIKSFLMTDSDYGVISDIKIDIDHIYRLVRNYIAEERLDICALKLGDRIFMSKTSIGFDDIYAVIQGHSLLKAKKDMIEIWDDTINKIIHFLIMPLRKHFPIEYTTEVERDEVIGTLLEEYSDIW
ncbi:hypothetical protein KEJ34_04535 [Candidatus Bathyarchaeota archaeon]|nr:hypothetical protein [Candidatus Bathyarchaeota archaeon]